MLQMHCKCIINDGENTSVYRLQELMVSTTFSRIHYSAKLYHHVSQIPIHSSSFHDYDGAKFTITMNVLICDVIVANRPNSFFKSRGVRAGVVNKASRATVLLKLFESESAITLVCTKITLWISIYLQRLCQGLRTVNSELVLVYIPSCDCAAL